MKTERIDRVRTALRAAGLTQMIVCDSAKWLNFWMLL